MPKYLAVNGCLRDRYGCRDGTGTFLTFSYFPKTDVVCVRYEGCGAHFRLLLKGGCFDIDVIISLRKNTVFYIKTRQQEAQNQFQLLISRFFDYFNLFTAFYLLLKFFHRTTKLTLFGKPVKPFKIKNVASRKMERIP